MTDAEWGIYYESIFIGMAPILIHMAILISEFILELITGRTRRYKKYLKSIMEAEAGIDVVNYNTGMIFLHAALFFMIACLFSTNLPYYIWGTIFFICSARFIYFRYFYKADTEKTH